MFTLITDDSYLWPVTIQIPRSGGSYKEHRLKARFKYVSQDEVDEILDQSANDEGTDEALMRRVLVGWEEFKDANGEPIDYNEDNLSQACRMIYIRTAIVRAFFASMAGKQGRRKN